jgi:hypothetical protein
MELEEVRQALQAESERVGELLTRLAGTEQDVFTRNESLLGYREGVEFALGLLAPGSEQEPEGSGGPQEPGRGEPTLHERPVPPEPELREQLTRVRDIES